MSALLMLWRFRYLIGIVSALASLGGAYGYVRVHYYNEGYNAAITKIAAKDRGALDAVQKKLKIVDECSNTGGEWDTTVGLCRPR